MAITLTLTLTLKLHPHPSWGVAVDSKGLVYYVDILHANGTLWQFDPQADKLTALMRGDFHAHGMQITNDDVLYIGIQLWKQGEIEGDGHNVFVRIDLKTFQYDTLVFSQNYARFSGTEALYDANRNRAYFVHDKLLRVFDFDNGETRVVCQKEFSRKCTMTLGPNDELYISDSEAYGGTIYQWSPHKGLRIYGKKLLNQNPEKPVHPEKRFQLFYGMDVTPSGELVYTESADRFVVTMDRKGIRNPVYQSPEHYHPSGVTYANGKYYITEVGYLSGKGHVGPNLVIVEGEEYERIEFAY